MECREWFLKFRWGVPETSLASGRNRATGRGDDVECFLKKGVIRVGGEREKGH